MTVEKYLMYLENKKTNKGVLGRYRKELKESENFFLANGIDTPDEKNFEELQEHLIANGTRKNFTVECLRITKDFYSWREAQQRATPVEESNTGTSETSITIEAVEAEKVNEPVTKTAMKENTEPVKPDEAQQTKPRGRKTYDSSGEKRTEKFTVYLTPTMSENVQDLARIKRKSVADYIATLIYEDCEREAERLAKFRELSNE